MRKTWNKAWPVLILLIIGFSSEFACTPRKPLDQVAIKINEHAVTVQEFQELYSELGPEKEETESRERFLENLITRKLLLLEAQREGLDQQKEFLKSIKNFWEQTLLKSIIDRKVAAIAAEVQVSDQEIEQSYQKWVLENPGSLKDEKEVRDMVRWQIIQRKQAQALQKWTDEVRNQAKIQVDRKAIGWE